jgi:hypothetical protein
MNDLNILLKSSILLLVIALSACNSKSVNPEKEKEIVLRLEPGKNNPRNSEGDFIQLNDGRILFVYSHFTDGTGDDANAYLAGRYSYDQGITWSTEDHIIIPNEGKKNIMSVSLLRLNDGRIALFYLRKNSEVDGIPMMRISTDEAKTWSAPKQCITDIPGYYVMNNDRVIQLKNGRILLPVAQHGRPESDDYSIGRLLCYYSDDNGLNWKRGNEIENPEKVTSQEPGVVALNDGRIMLFCRTKSGVQYISYSNDDGENWSTLKPSNIVSPLSPASIERIPQTGDLLMTWNNNQKALRGGNKRTPFNLAISKDEGDTWEKIKPIESDPNGWYCYTALEFVDDYLLLGHCAGDYKNFSGLETTQITKLTLDWIYKSATSNPYVLSDKNGEVILASKDKDAKIYYTTDNSFPTVASSQVYKKPIDIKTPALLHMFAKSPDLPESNLISTTIGEDIYFPANKNITITAQGLKYTYYEGNFRNTTDITDTHIVKKGVVGNFTIIDENSGSYFSIIYDGIISIEQDGKYTFYLSSNDGSTLYIDDYKVIDNDGLHSDSEEVTTLSLRKGLHKISVKYFQGALSKALKLSWSHDKISKTEIQAFVLSH